MPNYVMNLCKLSNEIKLNEIIPNRDLKIYHYTSPSGFRGIIENHTLRFTDRNFLNDYSEGIHVMDLCINNIDYLLSEHEQFRKELFKSCQERKKEPQTDDFYVHQCSFSTVEDSLCLWNYYTKGDNIQGYNLCFKSEELCAKLRLTSDMEDGSLPTIWRGEVIYDTDQQLEIVKEIINSFFILSEEDNNHKHYKFTIKYLVDKLMIAGMFFKKDFFEIEKEYRFVLDLHMDPNSGKFTAINEKQKYYEKNGILIPYVDIIFDPDALIQIGISPTLDLATTKNSIYRTTMKDFPQIKKKNAVKKSNIPIRY